MLWPVKEKGKGRRLPCPSRLSLADFRPLKLAATVPPACESLVLNTEKVSAEGLDGLKCCFSSRLYGLGHYRRVLQEALK
jgi:hypothetical protein